MERKEKQCFFKHLSFYASLDVFNKEKMTKFWSLSKLTSLCSHNPFIQFFFSLFKKKKQLKKSLFLSWVRHSECGDVVKGRIKKEVQRKRKKAYKEENIDTDWVYGSERCRFRHFHWLELQLIWHLNTFKLLLLLKGLALILIRCENLMVAG